MNKIIPMYIFLIIGICFKAYTSHCLDFTDIYQNKFTNSQVSSNSELQDYLNSKLNNSDSLIKQNIEVIDFSNVNLNTSTFNMVAEYLLNSKFPNVKILDFSSNRLDENSAVYLQKLRNQHTRCFIDICDNPVALKNIQKLYTKLQSESNINFEEFFEKIIFMSKGYAKKIRNNKNVQVYNSLVEQKILPSNWTEKHLEYYSLPIKLSLEKYRTDKRFNKCLLTLDQIALTTATDCKTRPKLTDESESMDFVKAMQSLSINR